MATSTELGLNVIPQYSNFSVSFQGVVRDEMALNFNTVGAWIFVLSPQVTGTGYILKASTGVASGDFTIDSVNSNVTVSIRASEINNDYGQYYVKLFAATSGNRITHRQKFITIERGLSSSGV